MTWKERQVSDEIGHTYAANYSDRIDVMYDRDSDPEGEPLLELIVDQDDTVLTLRLDSRQAKNLRLLIQKYERGIK